MIPERRAAAVLRQKRMDSVHNYPESNSGLAHTASPETAVVSEVWLVSHITQGTDNGHIQPLKGSGAMKSKAS